MVKGCGTSLEEHKAYILEIDTWLLVKAFNWGGRDRTKESHIWLKCGSNKHTLDYPTGNGAGDSEYLPFCEGCMVRKGYIW